MIAPGCGHQKRAVAKGLCATCYQRQRRRGLGVQPAKLLPGHVELHSKVPKATLKAIKAAAKSRGVTASDVVRATLLEAFGP